MTKRARAQFIKPIVNNRELPRGRMCLVILIVVCVFSLPTTTPANKLFFPSYLIHLACRRLLLPLLPLCIGLSLELSYCHRRANVRMTTDAIALSSFNAVYDLLKGIAPLHAHFIVVKRRREKENHSCRCIMPPFSHLLFIHTWLRERAREKFPSRFSLALANY